MMVDQVSSFGRRLPLNTRQVFVCACLGAVLWLAAALLLQWLGPMGVYEGAARIWLYLLIIPGTLPFIGLIAKLARLARHQIGVGVALATMTAILLDGVALAWFPALYGGEVELAAGAGAVILWGGGVAMALGWALNRA